MRSSVKNGSKLSKVLLVHNRYLIAGGERQVFEAELSLLRDNGHEVETFVEDNERVTELGYVQTAARTIWSTETHRLIAKKLREGQFDVVHVHNFFPLISPSIYYASQAEGVPVIQTLHNFRLLCLNGFLLRNGNVCQDCVGRPVPWPGIRHACYKESRNASITVAAMLSFHRAIRTWSKMVSTYIALTEFSRQIFVDGGLPADKVAVKPNFVSKDPGPGNGHGRYALFVGRLSPEKGVDTLLEAWKMLGETIPLKIVGDGPLSKSVADAAVALPGVEYLGRQDNDTVLGLMQEAAFLVFPSLWLENFPMTMVEAFATGLPVLASDLGNSANLIQTGKTGLHFRPGDASDLAEQARWLLHNPEVLRQMRLATRATYEQHYTPAENYRLLTEIYDKARAEYRGS